MYAVIKTGGKQYRVSEGQRLRVEKIDGDVGETLSIGEVLLLEKEGDVKVGNPVVPGASVEAEILSHGRGEKIHVFKKKRRKGYRRMKGHRQWYTELLVKEIKAD